MGQSSGSPERLTQRVRPREEDIRGPYLRDQTAIIHSLPFRRLKHKTQVFFAPENDHLCTRIEHVMHVATVATTIARGLNRNGWELNEELANAIGLGHDLRHAPFGHSGETILDELRHSSGEKFMHELNGLRVIDALANDGMGLNLTFAVRDGIVCHNGEIFEPFLRPAETLNDLSTIHDRNCRPSTWEGCIVRFADKIAYLGRDIEDAIEAGIITESQIPEPIRRELGAKNGEIIKTLVLDLIETSKNAGELRFSHDRFAIINELRRFNYQSIYFHPKLREYESFCRRIIRSLFEHLFGLLDKFGLEYPKYSESRIRLDRAFGHFLQKMQAFYDREGNLPHRMVTDYLSGMTDLYALSCIKEITLPPPLRFTAW